MRVRGGVEGVTMLNRDATGKVIRLYDRDDDDDNDDLDDDDFDYDRDNGTGLTYIVRDASGRILRGGLPERLGPKKKQSKMSRAIDKRLRKMTNRNLRSMTLYLKLHDRSNRRKENGWFWDLTKNLRRATRDPDDD